MKQHWLGYATAGKEQETADELNADGFTAWVPLQIQFVRTGKKRFAEPVISPYLPNYIFLELSPDDFYDIRGKPRKHLAPTMMQLSASAQRDVQRFRREVEAKFSEQQKAADNLLAGLASEFEPGEEVMPRLGQFEGVAMRFRRMVQKAHDLFPRVEVEADLMGRTVVMQLDPLDVERG